MSAIATLTEDYDGAAAGVAVSTVNTIFDNVSGTGTSNLFDASFPSASASKSQRLVAGGLNHINRADITPVTALFFSFYFYIETSPTVIGAILNWYSGITKIGDLQLDANNTLRLRDLNTSKWTSAALTVGEWHRIEVKMDPGETTGHLVNVWSGADLDEITTPSQTSGGQTSTNAGLASTATVSDVRMGIIGNDASAIYLFSRLRGDDAVFPDPISLLYTELGGSMLAEDGLFLNLEP